MLQRFLRTFRPRRWQSGLLWVLVAALGLGARPCAVQGQDLVPAASAGAAAAGVPLTSPTAAPVYAPSQTDVLGRSQIHLLSLRESVNLALENNLDIAVASYNPKIQGQAVVEAEAFFDPVFIGSASMSKLANLFAANRRDLDGNVIPGFELTTSQQYDKRFSARIEQNIITGGKMSLEYGFNRQLLPGFPVGSVTIPRALNPSYNTDLKWEARQPLLRGAGVDVSSRNIRVAINNRKISYYQFVNQFMDTMLDIQRSYWTLVLRIEELKIARQSLQRAEILMRNNEVRVRAGAMAPIELKVAQAEVATQQEGVIVAENNVRVSERELKRLMNVEKLTVMADTALVPSEYPRFDRKPIDEAYCIETALQKRPDHEQVKTDLENRKIDVKFTRNGLYPVLDLVTSVNLNGLNKDFETSNDTLSGLQYYDAFLGVEMTMPLGGNRQAKARYAAAQLTAARLLRELKRLELQIITDVRNTVSAVETNAKRVDTTRVARELRQERLDAAEKQLEVGRITSFEVVTAQEDLARAQGAEILAIIDYVVSLATLSRQIATILDEMGLLVEPPAILR